MDDQNKNKQDELKEEAAITENAEESPETQKEDLASQGEALQGSEDKKAAATASNAASRSLAETPNKTPETSGVQKNEGAEETSNQAPEKKEEPQELEEKPKDEDIEKAKKILAEQDLDDPAKWYIVHTYSGHENKVAKSIKQRIQSLGYENRIYDIIVPTRNTIKVSQGKKENVKEKIFPGYVLVKMILDNETWLLIRTTQGVTSFIGSGNKPIPISKQEVDAIMRFMEEEEPLYKTTYTVGEAVKIVDGPFADFLGTIDSIDEARGKVKVLVSIFGRETPVELDFLQVNKL